MTTPAITIYSESFIINIENEILKNENETLKNENETLKNKLHYITKYISQNMNNMVEYMKIHGLNVDSFQDETNLFDNNTTGHRFTTEFEEQFWKTLEESDNHEEEDNEKDSENHEEEDNEKDSENREEEDNEKDSENREEEYNMESTHDGINQEFWKTIEFNDEEYDMIRTICISDDEDDTDIMSDISDDEIQPFWKK